MKTSPATLLRTVLLACTFLSTGCIHTERTVYRDSPRVTVEFENDRAARVFYETLSRIRPTSSHSEEKTEVSLPIVFDHKERVVRGENEAFNSAVEQCDTNRDGKITEKEAEIFADWNGRKRK